MNLVDIGIILILGLAAAHGVTQGAALQVLSFGGFWLGLLLGAAVAPFFSQATTSPFGQAFISLLTFLGIALIGGALGRYFGTHAWARLQKLKLGPADAALGAVVAVIAALMAVWLIAILLTSSPTKNLARQVNRSAIVRALVEHLPAAPSVFSRVNKFISTTPFPRVFAGIEPGIPSGDIKVPGNATVQAAVRAAGHSTVRIVGVGCGGIQTGSGFVVGQDLVLTNAHVVAGITGPQVEDAGGRHDSQVVLFDPKVDVAILRTSGLVGSPLALLDSEAPNGQGGVVMGFPGGGSFSAGPGAVLRRFQAIGRDIYGRDLTRRDVYQLQATIRQGNSGGPFVRSDGTVLGVVFAASTTENNVGYALTSVEVLPEVRAARSAATPVSTGACTA